MQDLKSVLMIRDGIDEEEADELIESAKQELIELTDQGEFEEAYNICQYCSGLEPDYLIDLM